MPFLKCLVSIKSLGLSETKTVQLLDILVARENERLLELQKTLAASVMMQEDGGCDDDEVIDVSKMITLKSFSVSN